MSIFLRRRDFISGLGGVATPGAGVAVRPGTQDRRAGRRVDNDAILRSFIDAFKEELQKLGWVNGRNLQIVTLFAAQDAEQMRAIVSQILTIGPDAIVSNNTPIVLELQRRAPTVPIVFTTLADPVDTGIVTSLAHPGGNTTGFMNPEPAMSVKWLELLKEIVPRINHVLVMVNAGNAGNAARLRVIETFMATIRVRVSSYAIQDRADIESSINAVAGQPNVGIIAAPASPINEAHVDLRVGGAPPPAGHLCLQVLHRRRWTDVLRCGACTHVETSGHPQIVAFDQHSGDVLAVLIMPSDQTSRFVGFDGFVLKPGRDVFDKASRHAIDALLGNDDSLYYLIHFPLLLTYFTDGLAVG
jgi:putative ABC transport system substrate-binding protein